MDKEAGNSVQGLTCNFDLSFLCSYEKTTSTHHKKSNSSRIVTNEAPEITLLGSDIIRIQQGEEYSDAGAEAYDKEDGNITDKIVVKANGKDVDTSVPGAYTITYNVTDSDGNKADEVMRSVIVEEVVEVPEEEIPEGIPGKPVITLNGDEEVVLNFGDVYKDAGSTAVDKEDGDITEKIQVRVNGKEGKVNTDVPGNYIITYDVKDSNGNAANQVIRIIKVKQIEPVTDEEIDVPDEKIPEGISVLPKTGEESPYKYYLSGLLIVVSGLKLRKKDIEENEE
nr:immunoglobulin-like domain-containing protein [Clostridium aestuarii]